MLSERSANVAFLALDQPTVAREVAHASPAALELCRDAKRDDHPGVEQHCGDRVERMALALRTVDVTGHLRRPRRGYLRDSTGSYQSAFFIAGIGCIVAAVGAAQMTASKVTPAESVTN